jgi:hemolysin activation/secretion protein
MGRAFVIGVGSLLGVTLALTDAWGQVRPGTVQPGQIERQFERPPEPTAKPGAIAIPEAGQKVPPNAEGIRFVLNQLTIDGVTVYAADKLRPVYASALHTEVTLAQIYQMVDTLTARYRNDGYILSQVIVPAQSVDDGVVRLQAIEGYIADVRVEGGSAGLRGRAAKYGEKLRASRPLTAGVLERYVLLMNDLPGVQARAVLAPAGTPGASELVLQLSERSQSAGTSVDNRGSVMQGQQRVFGDADMYSLFRGPSLTEVRGVSTLTPELFYISAAHDQFFGTGGSKFGVAGSYSYSAPQEVAVIPLDLITKSGTLTFTYTYPLVRSRARNLYLRGAASAFNSTSTIFGVKDSVDHVRAVRLGATYDAADGLGGINIADFEFSQGIAGLGASVSGDEYLSRPSGQADFRKVTLYAARLQSLGARWSLVTAANGQYAFTDLLAPELFSFGGEVFGRGYDPSELLNDHGAALKAELQYSHVGRGRTILTPYGFADAGRVWQRTPIPGLASTQSAASAGGGIRFGKGARLSSFIEVAKPLTKIVLQENSRDARIYAGVSIH